MKKSIGMGVMFLAVLMMPQIGFSGIIADTDFTFNSLTNSDTFVVHSWVEDSPTNGYYRYFYEILEPGYNIQLFSVELLENATVANLKPVPSEAGDPVQWAVVGSNNSVDAFYISPVLPDEDSTTLWFDSPQLYTVADGSALGITGGSYYAFAGRLYSPIPEPATMALLAVGGVCAMRRKRN